MKSPETTSRVDVPSAVTNGGPHSRHAVRSPFPAETRRLRSSHRNPRATSGCPRSRHGGCPPGPSRVVDVPVPGHGGCSQRPRHGWMLPSAVTHGGPHSRHAVRSPFPAETRRLRSSHRNPRATSGCPRSRHGGCPPGPSRVDVPVPGHGGCSPRPRHGWMSPSAVTHGGPHSRHAVRSPFPAETRRLRSSHRNPRYRDVP